MCVHREAHCTRRLSSLPLSPSFSSLFSRSLPSGDVWTFSTCVAWPVWKTWLRVYAACKSPTTAPCCQDTRRGLMNGSRIFLFSLFPCFYRPHFSLFILVLPAPPLSSPYFFPFCFFNSSSFLVARLAKRPASLPLFRFLLAPGCERDAKRRSRRDAADLRGRSVTVHRSAFGHAAPTLFCSFFFCARNRSANWQKLECSRFPTKQLIPFSTFYSLLPYPPRNFSLCGEQRLCGGCRIYGTIVGNSRNSIVFTLAFKSCKTLIKFKETLEFVIFSIVKR